MKKVRYAMVGFGGIAENRLAKEGFALDKKRFKKPLATAELVAATDVNPARRKAAEALGLAWRASAEEILADPAIDAVFIATNNLTHAPLAEAALAAGKHVIVEKPMATTSAAAKKLLQLAKRKKRCLAVDHMMVHNAWNQKAKELVSKGKLGAVNDAKFHMDFAYGYDDAEAKSWRCDKPEELGGPIGDVASHCFYMAEFMFNSPVVGLAAAYWPKTMKIRAEDGAYIKFGLANGLRGSITAAFSELRGGLGGTLSNLGYELYGDRAVLRAYAALFQLSGHPDEPVPIRLELDTFKKQEAVKAGPVRNIYQGLVEKHAKAIRAGKPFQDEDGWHNLVLCEAAHKSAQNKGKWIAIR